MRRHSPTCMTSRGGSVSDLKRVYRTDRSKGTSGLGPDIPTIASVGTWRQRRLYPRPSRRGCLRRPYRTEGYRDSRLWPTDRYIGCDESIPEGYRLECLTIQLKTIINIFFCYIVIKSINKNNYKGIGSGIWVNTHAMAKREQTLRQICDSHSIRANNYLFGGKPTFDFSHTFNKRFITRSLNMCQTIDSFLFRIKSKAKTCGSPLRTGQKLTIFYN